ncbi:MAG TPA: DEAD/DEAH box helicase, partial [Chthonomonadales bacterium]|nr:DEAD/DEAH box helicase [Chthonomonadales bacterium]
MKGSGGEVKPVLEEFHEPVSAWFADTFDRPTRAQELGWPVILQGGHTLLLAPTGSGKTLAAFLVAIDRLMFDPLPESGRRCRLLYVSPLKALAVDVERNLKAPLAGVCRYAERAGVEAETPSIHLRTGDTPARERAQFAKRPADILITTPESLYLLLTSAAREALRSIRWVILDEIHAMVGAKRGAHLALSLERLQQITAAPFQRIGLSATQRPLEEVARFLGGFECVNPPAPHSGSRTAAEEANPETRPRPVTIVDAGSRKALDLRVEVPVEAMATLSAPQSSSIHPRRRLEARTSIWPAMHPLILDLIRRHTSTLIFVNSRRLAERLAAALNELAGEEIVQAHHGSIAREQRLLIEEALKAGKLPAIVATSSLELGIDMGAIDLVIQVESPTSVASAIQRIGRAGHQAGAASKGVLIPKYRGDLLSCAALTERMKAGAVEEMRYTRNPLDVLAQQIVAAVSMDDWPVADLERLIRCAAPFAELPGALYLQVLDMLSGRYPSDQFAELRPRITWDRLSGLLRSREGARRLAISSGGSIPDRGLFGVYLAGAEKGRGRVGELDEEMVFESHPGEVFLLGASSWRIEEITHDRVIVSPAPGEPGKMPYWHGDPVGRPMEFGRAIGALTRTIRALPPAEAVELLRNRHDLTEHAAQTLIQYISDQEASAGA